MKFTYVMPQHTSLTINKIDVENGKDQLLFVDGPDKQIDVVDMYSLKRQNSIEPMKSESIRCAISVGQTSNNNANRHIFVGCTNGYLMRLDPVNFASFLLYHRASVPLSSPDISYPHLVPNLKCSHFVFSSFFTETCLQVILIVSKWI